VVANEVSVTLVVSALIVEVARQVTPSVRPATLLRRMQVSFQRLPSIKFRIVLILMVRTKDSLLSLAVISAAVQRSQQRDHTENKYKDDLR
jgi:hypothetical protein